MRFGGQFGLVLAAALNACALSHRGHDSGQDARDLVDVPDVGDAEDLVDASADADATVEDVVDASDASDAVDVQPDAGPILWSVDFTTMPAGAAPVLPGGLVLRRASPATVQTGTSTVVTQGIGPDIARIGRANDADPLGLVIEEGRTNVLIDSRAVGARDWIVGSMSTTTADVVGGPDGQVLADQVMTSAGGYAPYVRSLFASGECSASGWFRGPGVSQVLFGNSATSGAASGATLPAYWQRLTLQQLAGGLPLYWEPVDGRDLTPLGGIASGARDSVVDMAQIEAGWFASEWIPTDGAEATRAADWLTLAGGALPSDAGRLALEFVLQVKGSIARSPHPLTLLAIDAANYVVINPTDGSVSVVVAGATRRLDLHAGWNDGDTIELFLAIGNGFGSSAARTNGGQVSLATAAVADGPVSPVGAFDLLSSPSGNVFSARARQIRAYRAGSRPEWVP